MTTTTPDGERLCEPCLTPDTLHIAADVDWIGDVPVMHGENDNAPWVDGAPYCLCGHPNYMTCPGEGVLSMLISRDGILNREGIPREDPR